MQKNLLEDIMLAPYRVNLNPVILPDSSVRTALYPAFNKIELINKSVALVEKVKEMKLTSKRIKKGGIYFDSLDKYRQSGQIEAGNILNRIACDKIEKNHIYYLAFKTNPIWIIGVEIFPPSKEIPRGKLCYLVKNNLEELWEIRLTVIKDNGFSEIAGWEFGSPIVEGYYELSLFATKSFINWSKEPWEGVK